MIEARVNFLKRGYYDPISETAARLIAEYAPDEAPISVCDMGSGEGWHSCRIASITAELSGKDTVLLGFDASKHGSDRASKLSRRLGLMPTEGIGAPHEGTAACFLPANIFHTPCPDRAFSAAVSMFAPVAWEEVHRILRDDGVLVVVSSGKDHLIELRQLIYTEVHISEDEITAPDTFMMTDRKELRYSVTLPDRDAIENLFMMTPFYYKTTEEGRDRLLAKDSLDVTVSVTYTVYRKKETEVSQ